MSTEENKLGDVFHAGYIAPVVQVAPRPMDTAPKDGSLVELLVDYSDGYNPLQDATKAWTIGMNGFDNHGIDEWKFVGWCWTHDHFTEGKGTLIGWRPSSLNEIIDE